MKRSLLLVAACALPAVAQADMIAYWNFNTLTTTANNGTMYAPTTGLGSLDLNVPSNDHTGSNRGITSFAGTTVNGVLGEVNGQALTIQGSGLESGAVLNNGSTLTLSFSMFNFEDVILSLASQRTATGFSSAQLAWSTDGVNFTDFGTALNGTTTFVATGIVSYDLSSVNALDNAATAFLRFTLTGATGITGNIRFDNIQLNANPVPTPAGLALMGLGGLVVARRRRA